MAYLRTLCVSFLLALSPITVLAQGSDSIIITEILYHGADLLGLGELEWVEVYNASASTVDLNGWTLRDPSPSVLEPGSHTIGAPVALEPGQYAVLCLYEASGLPCDYNYTGLDLNDVSDGLALDAPDGTEVDRVDYGGAGWPSPSQGQAIVYTGTTGLDNDQATKWAVATHRLGYTDSGPNSGSPRLRGRKQQTPVRATLEGRHGWRFLAAPIEGLLLQDYADQVWVQGVAERYPNAFPNVYLGYENAGTSESAAYWTPAQSLSDPLTSGRGYLAYVFAGDLPATISFDGPGPPGDVTVGGLAENQTWHFLGNPFPNGFDIEGVNLIDRGFQAAVQVWEPGDTETHQTGGVVNYGSYRVILPVSGAGENETDDLAPHQGFFAEQTTVTPGSGTLSLTFDQDAQVATRPTFYKSFPQTAARTGSQTPAGIQFRLVVRDNGTVVGGDEASWILFHPDASGRWDAYDATKLEPMSASFATISAMPHSSRDTPHAVASFPRFLIAPLNIPLDVSSSFGANTSYELSWRIGPEVPSAWTLTLNIGAETVDLRSAESVTLPSDVIRSYTIRSYTSDAETADASGQTAAGKAARSGGLQARSLHGPDRASAAKSASPLTLLVRPGQRWQDHVSAQPVPGGVVLRWGISPAKSSSAFVVEEISNGSAVPVGRVQPVPGASSAEYRVSETSPGARRYRVIAVDDAGRRTRVGEVAVDRRAAEDFGLRIAPHPVRDAGTARVMVPADGWLRADVFDVLGRRVATLYDGEAHMGNELQLRLNPDRLASGMYFLRVHQNERVQTIRFVTAP